MRIAAQWLNCILHRDLSRPIQLDNYLVKYKTTVIPKINIFIISMTKLLDADWLRGVQLFH